MYRSVRHVGIINLSGIWFGRDGTNIKFEVLAAFSSYFVIHGIYQEFAPYKKTVEECTFTFCCEIVNDL